MTLAKWQPRNPFSMGNSPTMASQRLNGVGEYTAYIFKIPLTGNIANIYFPIDISSSAGNALATLETLAGSNPSYPSGTLYHANATNTVAISTTNNIYYGCGFTAFPATANDEVALKITNQTGDYRPGYYTRDQDLRFPYIYRDIGSPGGVNATPSLLIEYDDGTLITPAGCNPMVGKTFEDITSSSNPNVLGMVIIPDYDWIVDAYWTGGQFTGNCNIKLVEADWNKSTGAGLLASDTITSATRYNTNYGLFYNYWGQEIQLTQGEKYRLIVEPTTATASRMYALAYPDGDYLDAYGLGDSSLAYATEAQNPTQDSDWTDFDNGTDGFKIYPSGLRVINTPSGGGGGGPFAYSHAA